MKKTPYIIYIRRASEGHCNNFTNDNYYPELTNYLFENYKTVYASPSYFYIVFKLKDKT